MQVKSKSQIKSVYYNLKLSNFLLCNTSFTWKYHTLLGKGGKLDITCLETNSVINVDAIVT